MSQIDAFSVLSQSIQAPNAPVLSPVESSHSDTMRQKLHELASAPALKDQLDSALEMNVLPEDRLTPERLDERNRETHETLEIRGMNAGIDAPQVQSPVQSEPLSVPQTPAPEIASQGSVTEITVSGENGTQEEVLLAVPEEMLDVISQMQKGLSLRNAPDLPTLEGWRDRLAVMLEQLRNGHDSATLLQVTVQQTQMQVQNAIISRGHLNERIRQLGDMVTAQLPAEKKLRNITEEFSRVWKAGLGQEQAAQALQSNVPERRLEAAKAFELGITMLGRDRETFEKTLTGAMANLVAELAPNCRLSHDTLSSLCLLTLYSGHDPMEMQSILSSAPQWAFTPEHEAALVDAMARGIIDARSETPETQRRATLQWVDMLFQGAKFEASEQALALKKMLLPEHEAEVELQHQCMTASSHLFTSILAAFSKESPSSLHTRTGTLDRAAQGVSAHSLVLTPGLVRTLSQNVRIPDFNYHLAHVALLQKRAVQAGLFDVPDSVKTQMASVSAWCRTLGLSESTASYAGQLDDALSAGGERSVQLTKRLVGASAHFMRGFEGQSGLAKAEKAVLGAARMTGTLGHDRRSEKIFKTSTSFKARSVLDHLVMNLATTEEARRRFADGSQGFALNGALVDQGIRERNTAAISEILGHSRTATALYAGDDARSSSLLMDTELEAALAHRRISQKEAIKEAAELKAHLALMDSIASASKETIRLVDRRKALSTDIDSMKAAASSVAFSWPHKHIARNEVCRHVLEIGRICKEVDRLRVRMERQPENAPLLSMAERELQEHLNALSGVHPLSLVPRSKLAGKTPSLEVVLNHMLPRAEALRYFSEPIYPSGLRSTRAKQAMERLDRLGKDLLDQHKIIDKGLKKLGKVIGSSSAKRLRQSVSAAILKVCAESQEPISTFSVNKPEHRERIEAQLRLWGLEPDLRLTKMLLQLGLHEMTDRNGRLRDTWLTRTMKDMDHSLARETAAAGFREQGHNWLTARIRAMHQVGTMLAPESRYLHEGVRGLMDQASLPGSGFSYSRSRGLSVDTGSVFTPLSGDKALVTAIDLSNPLSVRFKAMHDNSITVTNLGSDSYQVMLKGGFTGSLGATMKLGLGAGFTAPVSGSAGGTHGGGIVLTFTSRADTEAFLRAFMDPESDLHRKPWEKAPAAMPDAPRADGNDPAVWLKASQIRFVTDNSVSADFSVGLMHGLFTRIPKPAALSVSGTLSFTAQGSLTSSVQQNVHGEEAVFSLKGRITGTESVSAGMIGGGGTKLYGSPKAAQKEVRTIDVEQRFKLVTGAQGIMSGTCMETELSAGSMDHRVFRALFLPPGMSDKISSDPEINRKFTAFLTGLPSSARLTVRYALRPDVLADVRERFLQARLASPARRSALLMKIHDILDDTDSYEAASLQVKARKPVDVSKNWSPGLGHAQYKRETSFAQFVPLKTLDLAALIGQTAEY
ncbi:hypothetical protein [Mailhella sp.]|uniref:hypothetical protein n=1 Tax=Mailhella sp. TaxID=1981029 RepID=UPI00406390D9